MTLVTLVVVLAAIGIVLVIFFATFHKARELAMMKAERAQAHAQVIQDWKYTKAFEDMGNGVYHFEPPDDDEAFGPGNSRETQDSAKILGEWRALHPDRRIVSVVEMHRALIIVTEPR